MKSSIHNRLSQARHNLRWTQLDLAKATKLQPATISHFETGNRTPTIANLVKLAVSLKVSTDWLLGLNQSPQKQIPSVIIDGTTYLPTTSDQ